MGVHDWTAIDVGIFHDFHLGWIGALNRSLNSGLLPSTYYALAEQAPAPSDAIPPAHHGRPSGSTAGKLAMSSNRLVSAAAAPPRVRFTAAAQSASTALLSRRIAIYRANSDVLVATVEIISPNTKASRPALRAFVEKAVEALEAGIHVVLLDLFPPGPRDPQGIHGAVWSEIVDDGFRLPAEAPLTLVSYAAGYVKKAYIEPVAIGKPLPEMPLFLEPDRYVQLPLEASYRTAFDGIRRRWMSQPPTPSNNGQRPP